MKKYSLRLVGTSRTDVPSLLDDSFSFGFLFNKVFSVFDVSCAVVLSFLLLVVYLFNNEVNESDVV